jgi:hydrogenase maturation factor
MKHSRPKKLPAGKLPVRLLSRLLKRYAGSGHRVLIGPSIGLDAAVIDFGHRFLVAKTDPITFVSDDIGFYTVQINANDVAVMGGIPKWFLVSILLPEGKSTSKTVEKIFSDLGKACRSLGVSLCGGHTEITPGIDRPILIGQMLGEVERDNLVTAAGAREGDLLILTKGIALEGTSVLAREKRRELERKFSRRFVDRCRRLIRNPGISVLKEARVAMKTGRVRAMHDPTEGGLATGLHEMAIASDVGLRVRRESIPLFPEFQKLCDYFHLNPLGVIASGALLLSVPSQDAEIIVKGLNRERIKAWVIGRVTSRREGIKIEENGKKYALPLFEQDELTKVL